MTVVHNQPHPQAMTVVTPSNTAIFQKYGKLRIEDWDDRIAGLTWSEQINRSPAGAAAVYSAQLKQPSTPVSPTSSNFSVLRCHQLSTGTVVLIHTDWL
jgi:hypothetical protein